MTSWRTLVVVVVVVMITVAAGTLVIREQIRSRTLASTVDGVAILSSVVIDRSLTLTDITDGMSPVHHAELNADVILLKRNGEVVGLAIWSLGDGRLVYSDVSPNDPPPPPPDVLTWAREGKLFVAALSPHDEYADTLVVYYPYDANGDGTMDAVAEVVLPRQEVDESVAHSTRLLYLGGAIVLLLAIAGIVQVRRGQIGQDHAAVHDALTGLGNRQLMRRAAPPVLADATSQSPAALLLIDLDDFKAVNDTLGHHVGDAVLASVAGRIQQESGPSAVAVRLGGDEFAVLLPQVFDRGMAHAVAGRIRDGGAAPVDGRRLARWRWT